MRQCWPRSFPYGGTFVARSGHGVIPVIGNAHVLLMFIHVHEFSSTVHYFLLPIDVRVPESILPACSFVYARIL